MNIFIELWPFILGLLATGLIAGVLAGLLGVGGGIVIVPVLFAMFQALGLEPAVQMHLAVGTSLATIIPTSIRSLRGHAKKGAVDWVILKSWSPGLFIGVIIGSILAGFVDSQSLILLFASVALAISMNMAFGNANWRLGQSAPQGLLAYVLSGSTGTISTMMGIGGGTLGVPLMTLFGVAAQRAVATASGFGLIISIPATIGFIISGWNADDLPAGSLGYVNLIGFALITPMTILTAPLGVWMAHALPKKRLIQLFAFFLAVTSLRMFYGLLN